MQVMRHWLTTYELPQPEQQTSQNQLIECCAWTWTIGGVDLPVTPIYFSSSLGSRPKSRLLSLVFSLSVAFEHELKFFAVIQLWNVCYLRLHFNLFNSLLPWQQWQQHSNIHCNDVISSDVKSIRNKCIIWLEKIEDNYHEWKSVCWAGKEPVRIYVEFFVIPVTENKLSTGTEDALGVRITRASRLRWGYTFSFRFQNIKGSSFSSSDTATGPRYAVISSCKACPLWASATVVRTV